MATIQPFRAIRPNPLYADQLVFTKPQTESVAGKEDAAEALEPLKTLLEAGARKRPETPEGQAAAYQDIINSLEALLYGERLLKEEVPSIYVYEYVHRSYRQTGVWALTDLDDYRRGNIKIHELTFADSIRRMKNYREHTGLEGSPVLLTYPPDPVINQLINDIKKSEAKTTLGNKHGMHRLWKTENPQVIHQMVATFANVQTAYLADGHHRLESAAELAREQKAIQGPAYDHISSLYLATDQLKIQEYNRVVVPDQLIHGTELFSALSKKFEIWEAKGNRPVQPKEEHHLGMYLYGQWYRLKVKPEIYENKLILHTIDAAILQEHVLAPLFGIQDPKTDPRLKYAGGRKALEDIGALLQSHPGAIVFTLCSLTEKQLLTVANAEEILPPKSTWIDPKVPYGLLLHRHFYK